MKPPILPYLIVQSRYGVFVLFLKKKIKIIQISPPGSCMMFSVRGGETVMVLMLVMTGY